MKLVEEGRMWHKGEQTVKKVVFITEGRSAELISFRCGILL